MERVLGLVAFGPEIYPLYDDEHRFAVVRRFPYYLVYVVQPDRVSIIAVAFAGRAPGYWQGRT